MNEKRAAGRLILFFFLLIGPFATATAWAQQGIVPNVSGIPDFVGAGVGVVNEFEGSDDFTFGGLPIARLGWEERYLLLQGNTAYGNLLNSARWRLGPAGSFRFGRKDVEDNAVDRLADIDNTFELGVFGGVEFVNEVNARFRLTGRIEFLHDVAGEHDGFTIQAATRYWFPIHKILDGSIGISTTYANGSFMETYFGVTPADAQRSGLPTFDAGAGFKDISITPTLLLHLSKAWHLGLGVRYRRLLSDAADSPIVDIGGTANQFAAGAALIYAW